MHVTDQASHQCKRRSKVISVYFDPCTYWQ